MKNGVPWDVAHSLDPVRRLAYCIYFGEQEGNEYDFQAMQWKERS